MPNLGLFLLLLCLWTSASASSLAPSNQNSFVGIVEHAFSSRLMKPYKRHLPQPNIDICQKWTSDFPRKTSQKSFHAVDVMNSFLIGQWRARYEKSEPTKIKLLPIQFGMTADFFDCLSRLVRKGMKVINFSIGTAEPSAFPDPQMILDVGEKFESFAKKHPDTLIVLATGNRAKDLSQSQSVPQSLCSKKLANVICVSRHYEVRREGTPADPYQITGGYNASSLFLSCNSSCISTSHAAPIVARALYNRILNGSKPLEALKDILSRTQAVWGEADSKVIKVLRFQPKGKPGFDSQPLHP